MLRRFEIFEVFCLFSPLFAAMDPKGGWSRKDGSVKGGKAKGNGYDPYSPSNRSSAVGLNSPPRTFAMGKVRNVVFLTAVRSSPK